MSPNESAPIVVIAVVIAFIALMAWGAPQLLERGRKVGYQQCVAEEDDDKPRPSDEGEGVPGYNRARKL